MNSARRWSAHGTAAVSFSPAPSRAWPFSPAHNPAARCSSKNRSPNRNQSKMKTSETNNTGPSAGGTPWTDAMTLRFGWEAPVDNVPANFARALERDNAALSAEVERRRKDQERLDWLAENFHTHTFRYNAGQPTMNNTSPPHWRFWSPNEGTTSRSSIREAIDEAMRPADGKEAADA